MLKIDTKPVFDATVRVNTAAIQGDFRATFEALPSDELQALDDGSDGAWKKLLARVVVATEPVHIGGQPVEGHTPEGLAALIRWPGVGAAMCAAYYKGLWEAAAGN